MQGTKASMSLRSSKNVSNEGISVGIVFKRLFKSVFQDMSAVANKTPLRRSSEISRSSLLEYLGHLFCSRHTSTAVGTRSPAIARQVFSICFKYEITCYIDIRCAIHNGMPILPRQNRVQ